MNCQEFLTLHSEYIDERLPDRDADRCRVHAVACAACGRYDYILRRGQELLRRMPDPEVSPEFRSVLEYRLSHAREEAVGGRGTGAGAVLSLAIAAVLALAAWGPMLRADDDLAMRSDLAVEARTYGAAGVDGALLPAPDWFDAPTVARPFPGGMPAMRRIDLAFPGPYSPLVIMPPVADRQRNPGSAAARLTALE
jgi:hypothetical protein